nr:uncharacterized protein LOC122272586 [Parasteatoda tepidariorum]
MLRSKLTEAERAEAQESSVEYLKRYTQIIIISFSFLRSILAETATSVAAAANIPAYASIKTALYKTRNTLWPNLPKTVDDLLLQGSWCNTKNGAPFLLIDDGAGSHRILVFCTAENLRNLCASPKLFLDGTFKVTPKIFKQLYTLHGDYMGQIFPMAFCLLGGKTFALYKRLFELVKSAAWSHNYLLAPNFAMVDFELASIKALKEVFPSIEVKGCYFHFVQSLV